MRRDVLLDAAGALRDTYMRVDWAATPLGPVAAWSPALRNAVDLALHTQFPVSLLWGPEFVLVYNAAFIPLIADKHPAALGTPAREVFPEAWDAIGPMMQSVLAGEGATWVQDESVPLRRRGFLEEAYFTFSYSPVRNTDGVIEGVMDIATETTRQVIDRRRLDLLSRLQTEIGLADRPEAVWARALPILRENVHDLPFVDFEFSDAPDAPAAPTDGDLLLLDTGDERIVRLPLGADRHDHRYPVLVVRLSDRLAPDPDYLGFLRLIGSAIDQALVHGDEFALAEAVQRSLLTDPPEPSGIEIAVRYLPATERGRIGGDWYDAFIAPDGALTVVIGDVMGHDKQAAAVMGQLRNLLRGIAYTLDGSPGQVLGALDRAMHGLAVGDYATAILARVHPPELHWSNAGHPPPVLIAPDGRARLLDTLPDTLLGLGDGEHRDHALGLEPGATVVLYTDGLVERRRFPLQDRLDWLVALLDGRADMTPDQLCDHLLGVLDDGVEDDIALLILRWGEPLVMAGPDERGVSL